MKKNLQNAMTRNFQNMVGGPQQEEPQQESTSKIVKNSRTAASTKVEETPVMNEPIEASIPEQTPVVATPEPIAVQQPQFQQSQPVTNIPVTPSQPEEVIQQPSIIS